MRASNKTSEIVVSAILFLFFLQVLSDFIKSIYAFGLLVTAFTIQLASVVLLFTPLLLLWIRKMPSRAWMIGLASVAVLGRLVEPMLDPSGKLVACGVSVGAFMLLFPLLVAARRPSKATDGSPAAAGLLIAVSMSIFLRAANSSRDLSESRQLPGDRLGAGDIGGRADLEVRSLWIRAGKRSQTATLKRQRA